METKEIANLAGHILEPEYKSTNSLVKNCWFSFKMLWT